MIENNEGQCVYKEDEIAKVIVQYFNSMFTSAPSRGDSAATVNHALRPLVSEEENAKLIEIPSAEEIKEAVFSIHAEKASGSDGFSAGFFHTH